jgi:hypothetical protein
MLSSKDILAIVASNREIYKSILAIHQKNETNKWMLSRLNDNWNLVPKTTYASKDMKLAPGSVCLFEEHQNNKGNFQKTFNIPIDAEHKCLNVETFNDREACWYNYTFLCLKNNVVWKMAGYQITDKYLYKVIRNEPYTYEIIQKIIVK